MRQVLKLTESLIVYPKLHLRKRLVVLVLLKTVNWSQSLKTRHLAPRVLLSRNNAKDSLTISEGAPLAARC